MKRVQENLNQKVSKLMKNTQTVEFINNLCINRE